MEKKNIRGLATSGQQLTFFLTSKQGGEYKESCCWVGENGSFPFVVMARPYLQTGFGLGKDKDIRTELASTVLYLFSMTQ